MSRLIITQKTITIRDRHLNLNAMCWVVVFVDQFRPEFSPNFFLGIVIVFCDDECKKPYAVVECKRDGVTDAEFLQAIEQGVGNATWVNLLWQPAGYQGPSFSCRLHLYILHLCKSGMLAVFHRLLEDRQ